MTPLEQNELADILGGTEPVASWPTQQPSPVDTWQVELLLQQLDQQAQQAWLEMIAKLAA